MSAIAKYLSRFEMETAIVDEVIDAGWPDVHYIDGDAFWDFVEQSGARVEQSSGSPTCWTTLTSADGTRVTRLAVDFT